MKKVEEPKMTPRFLEDDVSKEIDYGEVRDGLITRQVKGSKVTSSKTFLFNYNVEAREHKSYMYDTSTRSRKRMFLQAHRPSGFPSSKYVPPKANSCPASNTIY